MEKHKKVHNSSKPIIEEEIYGEHCSCRKIFYDGEDLVKDLVIEFIIAAD